MSAYIYIFLKNTDTMGSWPSYPLAERPLTFRPDEDAAPEDHGDNSALDERLALVHRLWAEVAQPLNGAGGDADGGQLGGGPSSLDMYTRKYPDWRLTDLENLRLGRGRTASLYLFLLHTGGASTGTCMRALTLTTTA